MGYRRYHRKKSSSKEKEENFQLIFVMVVFVICFVFYFTRGFLSNCVFKWPIRWDVPTCWNEQISPAKKQATEKAANFVP